MLRPLKEHSWAYGNQRFCMLPVFAEIICKMQYFQSTLHAKLNILKKSSTFKGKCAVNAEIFLCNLLTGPLNMIFKGQWTILKERAFQQCTATWGIIFHETVPLTDLLSR